MGSGGVGGDGVGVGGAVGSGDGGVQGETSTSMTSHTTSSTSSSSSNKHNVKASPPAIAIVGANVTSVCNCNTSNFESLWPVVKGEGSWLVVVHEAGHLQVWCGVDTVVFWVLIMCVV